jgi:hypothetical protein
VVAYSLAEAHQAPCPRTPAFQPASGRRVIQFDRNDARASRPPRVGSRRQMRTRPSSSFPFGRPCGQSATARCMGLSVHKPKNEDSTSRPVNRGCGLRLWTGDGSCL